MWGSQITKFPFDLFDNEMRASTYVYLRDYMYHEPVSTYLITSYLVLLGQLVQ